VSSSRCSDSFGRRSLNVNPEPTSDPRRLGIYVDVRFYEIETRGGRSGLAVNRAAPLFACEVGRHFGRTVFFGRRSRTPIKGGLGQGEVELPHDVELIVLPDYSSLRNVLQVGRATLGTVGEMWRGLSHVDIVWAWGPHPFSILLVMFAAIRRKRVALCVREDTVQYHRQRLPNRRWLPILGLVWSTEAVYRVFARFFPTTAVGARVTQRYARGRSAVLPIAISLVRAEQVVPFPPSKDWTAEISLLTVGRLEPEKNPLLLIEALQRLDAQFPGLFKLVWLGRGRLEEDVIRRAKELGIENRLELQGYVPYGPELLAFYHRAHAFVHVSLTEGLPQVLIEAAAAGLPIVATDVGGVAAALNDGLAGVLVPPADVDALVGAIRRVYEDEALRQAIVTEGLRIAKQSTVEGVAAQVAPFIAGGSTKTSA